MLVLHSKLVEFLVYPWEFSLRDSKTAILKERFGHADSSFYYMFEAATTTAWATWRLKNPRGGSVSQVLRGKERHFLSVALRRTKCPVHLRYWREKYMGVSENGGTPKSSILIGFSIINHPFWGTPIFGIPHICVSARDKQSPRFRAITWQNWTKLSPLDATWCSTVADNLHTSYCWWLKSCTSWGNGSLSHYLQSFIYPNGGCLGFLPSTISISSFLFY